MLCKVSQRIAEGLVFVKTGKAAFTRKNIRIVASNGETVKSLETLLTFKFSSTVPRCCIHTSLRGCLAIQNFAAYSSRQFSTCQRDAHMEPEHASDSRLALYLPALPSQKAD